MFLIVKLLTWFGAAATEWIAYRWALVTLEHTLKGGLEATWRILRIGIVTGILIAALNAFVPPNFNLVTVWATYVADAAPWIGYMGYFVPLDLLFALIDLLVFATIVLVLFRLVRFVDGISK